MSEPLDELEFESELKHLRPAPLPAEVTARIAARLDRPIAAATTTAADWCLMSFMGVGALAASLIGVLVVSQALTDRSPGIGASTSPSVVAQQQQAPSPSLGEYQQALARSNDDNPAALELFR